MPAAFAGYESEFDFDAIQSLELDWEDHDGTIAVVPADQMRFEIKVRKAIEVLQAAKAVDEFKAQLDLLLVVLGKWVRDRTDIEGAHVTLRDGEFAFVVVRKDAAYDAKFEDELAKLDITIANDPDLKLIRLVALALPPTSPKALMSFLDPQFVLTYDGNRARSHRSRQQKPPGATAAT